MTMVTKAVNLIISKSSGAVKSITIFYLDTSPKWIGDSRSKMES